MVKRQFSGGKQFRPTVRGESNEGRRENGNEVVLSCLHSALSFVGPMDEGGNLLEGKRGLLAAEQGGKVRGSFVVQDKESERVQKAGKEFQDRLKRTHIGSRMARLHGYIPNVSMMSDYENVLVAIVGRDGKATGKVGGHPLVLVDRKRLRRVCGDGRNKAGREARDTRGRRRFGGDREGRRTQRDHSGRELGTRGGETTPESIEVAKGGREREG